jgi:hypothetical protein
MIKRYTDHSANERTNLFLSSLMVLLAFFLFVYMANQLIK